MESAAEGALSPPSHATWVLSAWGQGRFRGLGKRKAQKPRLSRISSGRSIFWLDVVPVGQPLKCHSANQSSEHKVSTLCEPPVFKSTGCVCGIVATIWQALTLCQSLGKCLTFVCFLSTSRVPCQPSLAVLGAALGGPFHSVVYSTFRWLWPTCMCPREAMTIALRGTEGKSLHVTEPLGDGVRIWTQATFSHHQYSTRGDKMCMWMWRCQQCLSLGGRLMGEFSLCVLFNVFQNFLHKHELLL